MPSQRANAKRRFLNHDSKGSKRKSSDVHDSVIAQVNFFHSTVAEFLPPDRDPCTAHRNSDASDGEESSCPLMSLPPEIRMLIYEYVLSKHNRIKLTRREQRVYQGQGPFLLRVSLTIRNEAMPVYFCCNQFKLRTRLDAFADVARWLETMIEKRCLTVFGQFSFLVGMSSRPGWTDLLNMLPLVQMFAAGRLKPDVQLIHTGERQPSRAKKRSLFQMNKPKGVYYIQLALEEAVLLAEQARVEKWSVDRVAEVFQHMGFEKGRDGTWWSSRRRRLQQG